MFEAAETGASVDKAEYEQRSADLRVQLINAQYDLRTADFSVVLVVAGDDWLAVEETLEGFCEWMDGRYIEIHALGEPTDEESERPLFWRYWRRLPRHGAMVAFADAWATHAIRERVLGDAEDAQFESMLRQISSFEGDLATNGALVLKFWMHLPKKEQKKRIKKARSSARGAWRLTPQVEALYGRLDGVMEAGQRLIEVTDEDNRPWHVIESTDHRHAGLAMSETILAALRDRLDRPPAAPEPPAPAEPRRNGNSLLSSVKLDHALERDEYKKALDEQQRRLFTLTQEATEKRISSVLVFEGWDAAGKGGVIRRIMRATDVRHTRVVPIAAPTAEEAAHHYLWRFWRSLPRAGRMVIFDRSWYGRVLVERVEGFASSAEWRRAYSELNSFEEELAEAGIVVQKFWLHIDPDEQLARFKARENEPYKKHKITEEDYRNREQWSAYEEAVGEMVARTSTTHAPWHLVPANNKPYARVEVLKLINEALEERV